mmetsp:Transcript_17060/g.27609  ORF Transcript_17060/g.27609 Transcript_17060/m.27609 type:complete len:159 (+) Transcript_17060:60-536(+)|eukprot:CAMPEP_0203752672 /NCGR_PEP_ID=MMETSP0098-20131031/6559_1 /ASSEMBLY_ACC=CAM_ASM_000208 /TAXON_ID=96639 /ORGANISM=" , Strain NY0313808BC1" /LENGTH=158 /DNA_ID=CAMNT_0050642935 /DNA_START=30 /DNA_END=506 /DNA_ORIENTATION=+
MDPPAPPSDSEGASGSPPAVRGGGLEPHARDQEEGVTKAQVGGTVSAGVVEEIGAGECERQGCQGVVEEEEEKCFPVMVNFDAANAPILKKRSLKFKSDVKIYDVHRLLKEKLKQDSLVLIVEKCFAPTLDQDLGTLYKLFARNDVLHITYGVQAVFG